MNRLVYIHGFNSSAQSLKAQQLKHWMSTQSFTVELLAPTLPSAPAAAIERLLPLITSARATGVIGSSLGGYYAAYLAEQTQCKAVLVNPAVRPYELLTSFWGENVNPYTGEVFDIGQSHLDQLLVLDTPILAEPSNIMLCVEKDDETLDYRQAVEKYPDVHQYVFDGGSHAFTRFESLLPSMWSFLQE